MRRFAVWRLNAGWQTRCDECGEVTDAASLAPLGSWFYKHTCPPQTRSAATESSRMRAAPPSGIDEAAVHHPTSAEGTT